MTFEEMKTEYKRLTDLANTQYIAATPERDALAKAEAPYHETLDKLEDMSDSFTCEDVLKCFNCSTLIFPGDNYFQYNDEGPACEECAPTNTDSLIEAKQYLDKGEWEDSGFDTKEELVAYIGRLTDDVAEKGDHSLAYKYELYTHDDQKGH